MDTEIQNHAESVGPSAAPSGPSRYPLLPLFALLYIVTSYLAAGLATCAAEGRIIREMTEAGAPVWDWIAFWLQASVECYRTDWLILCKWYAVPLWLVCGLLFFLAARRYWRSGQAKDGWLLAGITLLWSAGGAELFLYLWFTLQRGL